MDCTMGNISSPCAGANIANRCAAKRQTPGVRAYSVDRCAAERHALGGRTKGVDGYIAKHYASGGSRHCCVKIAEESTDNADERHVSEDVARLCAGARIVDKGTNKRHVLSSSGLQHAKVCVDNLAKHRAVDGIASPCACAKSVEPCLGWYDQSLQWTAEHKWRHFERCTLGSSRL